MIYDATQIRIKQIEYMGNTIEVEQLGRGALATVIAGKYAGSSRFASTMDVAQGLMTDAIAAHEAKLICDALVK